MTGDNSVAMKKSREYNRLLIAILEGKPKYLIEKFANEFTDYGTPEEGFDEKLKQTIKEAYADSLNYFIHYQSGHAIAIRKNSLLGLQLFKQSLPKKKDD